MGESVGWLAVRGVPPAEVLEALELVRTDAPDTTDAEWTGVLLPDGWYVVVSRAGVDPLVDPARLARLSAGAGELVACFLEEHVMCSTTFAWRSGAEVWSVDHDPAEEAGLRATGKVPPAFRSLRKAAEARQAEEDAGRQQVDFLFDVPIELARLVTGFAHDAAPEGARFEVLRRTRPHAAQARLDVVERLGLGLLTAFAAALLLASAWTLVGLVRLAGEGGFVSPWSPWTVLPMGAGGVLTLGVVTVGLVRRVLTGRMLPLSPPALHGSFYALVALTGVVSGLRMAPAWEMVLFTVTIGAVFAGLAWRTLRGRAGPRRAGTPQSRW